VLTSSHALTAPAQVVELGSTVHGAAIVPHDEVVQAPTMRVDELPLGRMRDELVDQCPALVIRHAEDAIITRGRTSSCWIMVDNAIFGQIVCVVGQARSTAKRLRSASEQWPRAPS
jgi:hypothetical protein